MKFDTFLKYIPKIEKENLLGAEAHQIMSPPERKALMENINLESKNPKKAAIMMLLYPKNNDTHLILIVRNSYPGVHSSQIAFPGGKVEKEDFNLEKTALRETHEEVGIHPNQINVVRAFTEVYIPPSNFLVFPFLGYSSDELIFTPDSKEVESIIELPLVDFLNQKNIVNQRMSTSYSDNIEVPSFKVKEHYVWGATALMMSELKETLKKVL